MPRPSLGDVIAGVSVGLVLIPQSMAYAELAGMPAYVGLFAGALPPLLAAPFASSPYLQTGPVALTSLLTFGALEDRAELASVDYVALARPWIWLLEADPEANPRQLAVYDALLDDYPVVADLRGTHSPLGWDQAIQDVDEASTD